MAKTTSQPTSKSTKILITIVILLGIIPNCWLMYYSMYLKDNTMALQTAFINDATYSEQDKYFMEVNVYDDVVEWKWNYYIDTSLPEQEEDGTYGTKYMFSTGVQFYNLKDFADKYKDRQGGFAGINGKVYQGYKLKNCTYYSMPDGIDYGYKSGGTKLADQNAWIWDIKGELCAIQTLGDVYEKKTGWGNKYYNVMDPSRLIAENMGAVRSFNDGVTITYFDFSKYFTVMMYNSATDRFDKPCQDQNILKEWTFVTVKVTKSSHKFISAKQSLFGSFKGDPNYEKDGGNNELYWRDETIYTVNNDDFRFTSTNGGYLISLRTSCVDFLSEFSDVAIDVEINLDEFDSVLNVLGFYNDPFYGLAVNKIKITSSTQRNFICDLEGIEIETSNVNIVTNASQNLSTNSNLYKLQVPKYHLFESYDLRYGGVA